MADHLVRAVFPSNGAVRVLCSCGHRSSGSDYRAAHEAHDTHVAEPAEVEQ